MLKLAFTNLVAKKARTLLALLGLSIAILGVIALISVSGGIETMFRDTLTLVEGITVLRKGVPSPTFSRIPAVDGDAMEQKVPGVEVAVATIWHPAFVIDGKQPYQEGQILNMYVIVGTDVEKRKRLKDGGVFKRHLKKGRMLGEGPGGDAALEAMISEDAVRYFGKTVGAKLNLGQGLEVEIVGVFRTGSLILDRNIIVPIGCARKLSHMEDDTVSNYYVQTKPGADASAVGKAIEANLPHLDARTPAEVETEFSFVFRDLDLFLAAIASIAILVGAVGVVNTMLMSVTERVTEFGVLRATGWTRRDVLRLVVLESAAIGVVGGVVGCATGAGIVRLAGLFLPVAPVATPALLGVSFAVAIGLGVVGGLYPAWRASRLDPIHAIRHI